MTWFSCDSVTKYEGLRSPKAIAFIFDKCSRNPNCVRLNDYCAISASPQKVTKLLKLEKRIENTLNETLTEIKGELRWTD